jgi:hypothetical protein
MSKLETDYSNTIIYKISCKDSTIKDVYVGHTTNFVQRKRAHRQSCTNATSVNYKCKVYEVIRSHGGWSNWSMDIINFFTCKDQCEARKKEQEYFVSLNATLNSIEPFPTRKVIEPDINSKQLVIDIPQIEDKNNELLINIDCINNNYKPFNCEHCLFKCNKNSEWLRHLNTKKHKVSSEQLIHKSNKSHKICNNCSKIYKSREGLWYHIKKCKPINKESTIINKESTIINNEISSLINLVKELIQNNNDLQKQMADLIINNKNDKNED